MSILINYLFFNVVLNKYYFHMNDLCVIINSKYCKQTRKNMNYKFMRMIQFCRLGFVLIMMIYYNVLYNILHKRLIKTFKLRSHRMIRTLCYDFMLTTPRRVTKVLIFDYFFLATFYGGSLLAGFQYFIAFLN